MAKFKITNNRRESLAFQAGSTSSLEKLAYIAALKELCPNLDRRNEVLIRHMERLDV